MKKVVKISLQHSFFLNREPKVKKLSSHQRQLQEQKESMRTYEQLKAWVEIVISSEGEEELTNHIVVSSASGPSTSKTVGKN